MRGGRSAPEENKDTVRRMVEAVNAGHEDTAVDELFAPRAARRVKRLFAEFRSAFPDWREEIAELVAEGNTVAGRFRCSGTHLGEFLGEAPMGKRMEVEEVFFLRVQDGKFVQFWGWRTAWAGCGNSDSSPLVAARRLDPMTENKPRVLFLCTHNSARSQMAEGVLRELAGDRFEVHSAGTEATHVRPLAIRAMDEMGINISGQESKTLERYVGEPFDHVITVCDEANEACPFFPGAKNRLHWSFADPSQATGSEEERLAVFRRVRDEIRERIEQELVHEN